MEMEVKIGDGSYKIEVSEEDFKKNEAWISGRELGMKIRDVLNMKDLYLRNIEINCDDDGLPVIKFERLLTKGEWEGVVTVLEEYELGKKNKMEKCVILKKGELNC